jgi:hypothetical protein
MRTRKIDFFINLDYLRGKSKVPYINVLERYFVSIEGEKTYKILKT